MFSQRRRGKGTFREAASEQSEKVQFLSFRDRAVRQVSAANRNRTDRVHRIHRKGSGKTFFFPRFLPSHFIKIYINVSFF